VSSILQPWVSGLVLRHQGVLVTAAYCCDSSPKHDSSKLFSRCYRNVVLRAHCGDAKNSRSFIEEVTTRELHERFNNFRKNLDHYPHHYVMHVVHAIEIIGYKHPDADIRQHWNSFYLKLCDGLHVNPETENELDARLDATEDIFGNRNDS
jgi:hypothetical protein